MKNHPQFAVFSVSEAECQREKAGMLTVACELYGSPLWAFYCKVLTNFHGIITTFITWLLNVNMPFHFSPWFVSAYSGGHGCHMRLLAESGGQWETQLPVIGSNLGLFIKAFHSFHEILASLQPGF